MNRQILLAVARGETVALDDGVDVRGLIALADAEGMTPLLARAARGSSEALRPLRVCGARAESHASAMLDELARIVDAFRRRAVPLLVMKGAVLSQQLYGAPGLRSFADLDVIAGDAERGEAILRDLGYAEAEPVPRGQLGAHRRFHNATLFLRADILVDFHWGFGSVQFPLRLTFEEAWRRRTIVVIHGVAYPTLADEYLALHLLNHAAKHLWNHLEYFAQIAALERNGIEWSTVESLAHRAGARRRVELSRALTRHVLEGSPSAEPLAAVVERSLFSTESRRMDAAGRDHFLLLDHRLDALFALAAAAFVPTHSDWRGAPLPAPLYWLRRPLRLALRRARAAN